MAKVEKRIFMKRLNELEIEDTVLISLMEDLEDSWEENSSANNTDFENIRAENTRLQGELTDLQTKYKERFMNPLNINKEQNDEGLKEVNVVDIKEI